MPRKPLTATAVAKLKPPKQGRIEKFDASLPGFGVRVTANGAKSWIVLYTFGGRRRRYTIGTIDQYSLSDAREEAREAIRNVAKGIDPVEERRASRTTRPDTFGSAIDEFIEKHVSKQTERGQKESRRPLERLRQQWGEGRALDEISRRDILNYRNGLIAAGTPYAAERAVTTLKTFFGWCVDQGYLESSPAILVKSPFKKGERERQSRKRVLEDVEVLEIWKGSDSLGYPFGDFIKMLFMTAQRRSEVARMEWREIDLDTELWVIPAEKTKARRDDHEVPLCKLAVELLRTVPRQEGPFVLSTTGGLRPISGFSKAKSNLDSAIFAQRRSDAERFGEDVENVEPIADWRLHDIRRTVITEMAALGVRELVYKQVLNHSLPSILGVTGTYNRYTYRHEKRDALDVWEHRLEQILGDGGDNVVELANVRG